MKKHCNAVLSVGGINVEDWNKLSALAFHINTMKHGEIIRGDGMKLVEDIRNTSSDTYYTSFPRLVMFLKN